MGLPLNARTAIKKQLRQTCVSFEGEGTFFKIKGEFQGTTQSGWAIPTTYGNTITFLAMANFISDGVKMDCFASGDDMLMVTEGMYAES